MTNQMKTKDPLAPSSARIVYQAETDISPIGSHDIDIEDGGQAMIVHVDAETDAHMFVRLQSWQENARRDDDTSHATLRSILGRRIRITIEDLGPAAER